MFAGRRESFTLQSNGGPSRLGRSSSDINIKPIFSNDKEEEKSYLKRIIFRTQLASRLMFPIKSLNTWLVARIDEGVQFLSRQFNRFTISKSKHSIVRMGTSDASQLRNNLQAVSYCKPLDFSSFFSTNGKKNCKKEQRKYKCSTQVKENAIALYRQRKITEVELNFLFNIPIDSLDKRLVREVRKDVKKLSGKLNKILIGNSKKSSVTTKLSFSAYQPVSDNNIDNSASLKPPSTFETSLHYNNKTKLSNFSDDDERKNAVRLYKNGVISKKQLALIFNISIECLDTCSTVNIQEDKKKLGSLLRSIKANLTLSNENDQYSASQVRLTVLQTLIEKGSIDDRNISPKLSSICLESTSDRSGPTCSQNLKSIPPTETSTSVISKKNAGKKSLVKHRKYSKEQKESVLAQYLDNDISVRDLANQTGMSVKTLYHWTVGLKKTKRVCRSYSVNEKKRALDFYRQSDLSVDETAQKLGIPWTTLNYWIIKMSSKKPKKRYTREEKARVLELYRHGDFTLKEAAQKLEIPLETLSRWLFRTKSNKASKKYTPEERKKVLEILHQDNITQIEAARQLKIPRSTLQSWVHQEKKNAMKN